MLSCSAQILILLIVVRSFKIDSTTVDAEWRRFHSTISRHFAGYDSSKTCCLVAGSMDLKLLWRPRRYALPDHELPASTPIAGSVQPTYRSDIAYTCCNARAGENLSSLFFDIKHD
ncbi:hypothetical protein B0H34DRAFT_247830 [Crassisporium funariophilum]|nr:hypothetical protein B0H34DRAFT_247830 [Crassisporium funariophilum]